MFTDCYSNEAYDGSSRRGPSGFYQPGQHTATVRVRATEGEGQASERPSRVTHGQAPGAGGEHG